MFDGIFLAVLVAGVTGFIVTPLALVEIIRLGRKNRDLAERNAAQAMGLAMLAERGHRPAQVAEEDYHPHSSVIHPYVDDRWFF